MSKRPKRKNVARALRRRAVPAEVLLWKAVRNRALGGFKFRRSHPIGPYFADFACVACRVVVELDGESHLSRQHTDTERTKFMAAKGWCVLRY